MCPVKQLSVYDKQSLLWYNHIWHHVFRIQWRLFFDPYFFLSQH